jgi:hypothetical protein
LPPAKSSQYPSKYKLWLIEDKKVLEPNHLDSIAAQENFALIIPQDCALTVMNLTVQLKSESL